MEVVRMRVTKKKEKRMTCFEVFAEQLFVVIFKIFTGGDGKQCVRLCLSRLGTAQLILGTVSACLSLCSRLM